MDRISNRFVARRYRDCLALAVMAVLTSGCTSQENVSPDVPSAVVKSEKPKELAAAALDPSHNIATKRAAVRGLASQAAGIPPVEFGEVEFDRFRLAKVASIPKGTADMESVGYLRTLLRESKDSKVIAEAIRGLGHVRDADSVPEMLDLLSHEDISVGEAAQYSLSRILGYRPSQQDPVVFYRELIAKNPNLLNNLKNPARKAEARQRLREEQARKARP